MAPLTVLLVEDSITNLTSMTKMVRTIDRCVALPFSSPLEVIDRLPTLAFDLAVVDYRMPGMNGIELIARIRSDPARLDKPIVLITSSSHPDVRLAALEAGAMEFLQKPIHAAEFTTRIRNLGAMCDIQHKLADQAAWLRAEVEVATRELRLREEEIIHRLSLAAGFKDWETAAHNLRMARVCGALAAELGLPPAECRDIELAAPMHDVGKVGIRDDVLRKPGRYDAAEFEHMKEHARIGGEILGGSSSGLLCLAATIAISHHERWDGTGYPHGLAGEAIPLVGRIAAIADVFDALTSERPYKRAWSRSEAVDYIMGEAGRQFDPLCVRAFQRLALAAPTAKPRSAMAA